MSAIYFSITCRQASLVFLWSHTVVKQPWLFSGLFLNGSICCFKNCKYHSASMVLSQMCKLPVPWTLIHPQAITDVGVWLCVGNSQDGLFSSSALQVLYFQKPFETREHCIGPSQLNSSPEKTVFNALVPEGLKAMTNKFCFLSSPLTCRDFSTLSKSFDDIIGGEIPKEMSV